MDVWGLAQLVLETVLRALLPVLLGALVIWLNSLVATWKAELTERIGERRLWQMTEIVRQAVAAAEQTGLASDVADLSAHKKELAIRYAQGLLETRGIDLDLESLSALIEAEVFNAFNRPAALKVG